MKGCGLLWLLGIGLFFLVLFLHVVGTLRVTTEPSALAPFIGAFIIICIASLPGLLLLMLGRKK